jgi:hypothetical protein
LNIRACPAFIPDELEFMILHRRIQVVKWGWRSLDGNMQPESSAWFSHVCLMLLQTIMTVAGWHLLIAQWQQKQSAVPWYVTESCNKLEM